MRWIAVARAEMARRRRQMSPMTSFILALVLISFILTAMYLSKMQPIEHTYYKIHAPTSVADWFVNSSFAFVDNQTSIVEIIETNNGLRARAPNGLLSYAAIDALTIYVEQTTQAQLQIRLETRAREEILEKQNRSQRLSLQQIQQNQNSQQNQNITQLITSKKESSPSLITLQSEASQNIEQTQIILSNAEQTTDLSVISIDEKTEEATTEKEKIVSVTNHSFTNSINETETIQTTVSIEETATRKISENGESVNATSIEYISISQLNSFSHITHLFLVLQILIVCNFLSAIFGNSVYDEKVNRKSSLLFLTKLGPLEWMFGKFSTYFFVGIVIATVLLLFQYPHAWWTLPFLYTVIGLYLSVTIVIGLIARSSKEFSFLQVFSSSVLGLYFLIPAFLAQFSKLGYASLFTPVVFASAKMPVDVGIVLFLLPIHIAIIVIVWNSVRAIITFEILYKGLNPLAALKTIIDYAVVGPWQSFIAGSFAVPILWIMQLALIAVHLTYHFPLWIFFFVAAFFEEFIRNAMIGDKRIQSLLMLALGFIIAEKGVLLLAIAPYLEGFELLITAAVIVPFALHFIMSYLYTKMYPQFSHFTICVLLGFIHGLINLLVFYLGGLI